MADQRAADGAAAGDVAGAPGAESARGYVVDTAYPVQDHPDLDPTRQWATLLAAGYGQRNLGEPFRYLELGCGPGFSLAAYAAAQPDSQFIGVDINPAHIEALAALSRDAGLSNLQSLCASFDTLDAGALGKVQAASAHGVWSWVSAESRRDIVKLLAATLKERGVFYLSYNCLPGMAAIAPIRTLMLLAPSGNAPTVDRVAQAVEFVARMDQAGSDFLAGEQVRSRLEELRAEAPEYLAHEYFNRDWTAFYHHEVAAGLMPAGLNFAAASRIADNLESARFSSPQRSLLDEAPGGPQRETVKDFLTNRAFRADLFVRGHRRLSSRARSQLFGTARLVCVRRLEDFPPDAPPGYARIVALLSDQPASLRELQSAPGLGDRYGPERLQEMVLELMAMEIIALCLPKSGERRREASTARFNKVVLERVKGGQILPGLASPVTGGVFPLSADQLQAVAAGGAAGAGGLAAVLHRLKIL